ncbi:hypothetical protein ACOME3_000920 [Neoechinorhynchus agilis]
MLERLLLKLYRYRFLLYRRMILKPRYITPMDPIRVLYADKDFVVIDKDCGVAVQKTSGVTGGYVNLMDQLHNSGLGTLLHCHRLDATTSGCLLLATNPCACLLAMEMFRRRNTIKLYLALVRGHLDSNVPIHINRPIGLDRSDSTCRLQSCADDAIGPKSAETCVYPLSKGTYLGQNVTKVLVRIFTGRTHQIRVHLSHIGHHVVGDFIYSYRRDYKAPRLMLHSYHKSYPAHL